jgi:hypothetical protein
LGLTLAATCSIGQQEPKDKPALASVCEILANAARYADTDVAIVGRLERSVSLVDHYEYLSEDQCARPLITHGHTFPNRIQILTYWELGMPKPPDVTRTFERTRIAAKLSEVRKKTELGTHEEPQISSKSEVRTVSVPNKWALVYGHLVKSPDLNKDCGIDGCGEGDVPLIIIAKEREVHSFTDLPPSRK